ncbi:GNAT family N-acetyltransferase [Prochlorococcus sp. MIT 1341]|uniref:GNAT family N-acetyltransferase n=1 Tax=Prochlorococcus sp. MIT 1341 TaxID=3096221 RepID=UPI002A74E13D|nr:GNAT family N-acetyltransferase [Prochlorococcus sp. MIT 1341]
MSESFPEPLKRKSFLTIKPLEAADIPLVTEWARQEGFAPGNGDVGIYQHTDRQGLWVGWLGEKPIGCIAGVRYNSEYGFLGLFLVIPEERGHGYGVQLWQHALEHLADLPCIGLEAALNRIDDYKKWDFSVSSSTTRWQWFGDGAGASKTPYNYDEQHGELKLLSGQSIPPSSVQAYDAMREPSPRPHFIADWIKHPAGTVMALVDSNGCCHGFGRIRPCLLTKGEGWRIGPLLANSQDLAEILLNSLIRRHPGAVLLDAPGSNPLADQLFERLGFKALSTTVRMYRGQQPPISMKDVYGLACLELG